MLYQSLIGAIAAATVLCSALSGAQAQDLSKYPDWSGQWKRPPGAGIQWDQTKPFGRGQQAPLTPEYQARYEANLADQSAGGQGDDTTGQCIPHGMPRVMTVVYPMEIIIMPKTTYILTDYTVPRRVFTDGRDWPKEIEPTFNGLSIGKWVDQGADGRYSTLQVETRGFKSPRTYEASGIRLHDDGQTVIKERIYLDKNNKDTLLDEITTVDNALTGPWTITKKYIRESNPNVIWHFNDCSENNAHVFVGKESYFVTADGFLMPVKKEQRPPDLRYFNQSGK
jgi:hypothetical protein